MHEGSLLFRRKACGVRHLTKHEWVLWSVSTILPTLGVLPGEALYSRHRGQTEIMGVNPHGLARASSQAVGHSSHQAHYMWPHLVSSASHIVAVAEGNWGVSTLGPVLFLLKSEEESLTLTNAGSVHHGKTISKAHKGFRWWAIVGFDSQNPLIK